MLPPYFDSERRAYAWLGVAVLVNAAIGAAVAASVVPNRPAAAAVAGGIIGARFLPHYTPAAWLFRATHPAFRKANAPIVMHAVSDGRRILVPKGEGLPMPMGHANFEYIAVREDPTIRAVFNPRVTKNCIGWIRNQDMVT